MHEFHCGQRRYLQFESLRTQSGLVHAFSTRPQDVSARTDERQAERAFNRRQMADDLGLRAEALAHCVQVHFDMIAIVEADRGGAWEGYDAIATNRPAVPLMTFSADCPLILVYSAAPAAIALIHASWRCTAARLVQRTVQRITHAFACSPHTLHAGIGPGAGPCCYEVKQDVQAAFAGLPGTDALFQEREGRMFLDLWQANRAQLIESGVPAENIEAAGICTMCRTDLLYSFRREKAGCGHFGLMAALRPD